MERILNEIMGYYDPSTVRDAMEYSLLDGGKRLRPRLLLSVLKDYGVPIELGFYPACALEMVHTYSLVHDDLPAMDDDDIRRFKPTNHKVYGEGYAILAGDGLLTGAFTALTQSSLEDDKKVRCMEVLARNAGANGMILGQELDIANAITDVDDLIACYGLKTGCLFSAAFEMALIIAGKDSLQTVGYNLGQKLGIAFQFQDDLLEATATDEEIGKSVNSDTNRQKHTIVSFCGIEEATSRYELLFEEIIEELEVLGLNSGSLREVIEEMVRRKI